MFELIIWASDNFDFKKAGNTLFEDPRTNFLHDFNVSSRTLPITNVEFLREFEWEVLDAGVKPQCHVIILDSREVAEANLIAVQKVCACAISFVTTRPMKFLLFYDIQSQSTIEQTTQGALLYHYIYEHTVQMPLYSRVLLHEGTPVSDRYLANGQMGASGIKIIARNVIIQTQIIFQND